MPSAIVRRRSDGIYEIAPQGAKRTMTPVRALAIAFGASLGGGAAVAALAALAGLEIIIAAIALAVLLRVVYVLLVAANGAAPEPLPACLHASKVSRGP
jgi:hypothetical protein